MTQKKKSILSTALELFARDGYHATSTGNLAKAAGVSEGLIFRHFGSKSGLLQAILDEGEEKAATLYSPVLTESDARLALSQMLDLPLSIPKSDYPYWRLVYALRWSQGLLDKGIIAPLREKINSCLQAIGKETPEAESEFLGLYLDGVVSTILLKDKKPGPALQALMKERYE